MKSKTTKNSEVEHLRRQIAGFPTVVICAFEGLSVEQDWQLRERVRDSGGEYQVVKNRLARLAAEGTSFEPALDGLRGMTSLAFASDDPIGLLKALVGFAKEHPVFQFKAGVVEGRVVDVAALNELASLPGREGLYAKLLYLINAPAQRLLSVVNGTARDLAIVLQQAVEQEKLSA
jgi:large subunit ribosomal protein L10